MPPTPRRRRRRRARVPELAAVAALAGLASMAAGCSAAEPVTAPSTPVQTSTGTTTPAGTPGPTESLTSVPPSESADPSASAAPDTLGVVPAEVSVVATGLDVPWGLAFLPDGSALVSERDTALVKRVSADGDVSTVGEIPDVVPGDEGGLLGLAVAPTFARDRWVYAYLTAAEDNKVVRMRYEKGTLSEPEVILEGIPRFPLHNGGRLRFGPDGRLYVATGDAGEGANAADRDSLGGKILRIEPDGSVPAGNPFDSPVWSYGHRNVQGLDFDDAGRLWASEFGQDTWDELNLIRRGADYGWPRVEGSAGVAGLVDPVRQWNPDVASPSGLAWVRDTVFMAALGGTRLWVIPVPGGQAGEPADFLVGEYGRLRTVEVAPDGSLWLTTSNTDGRGIPAEGDDRILRVTLRPARS